VWELQRKSTQQEQIQGHIKQNKVFSAGHKIEYSNLGTRFMAVIGAIKITPVI
jgi:hypothetical protein